MSDLTIKSVAIVGNGVCAWMSGAVLATMLGASVSVRVVETEDALGCRHINASLPPIKALHAMLGIEEADLLSKTRGSMKLGTQFVNWGSLGNRYLHPHGTYGAEFDPVALHQWWLKSRATDEQTPDLQALSLATALVSEGRFTHPSPDRRLIQSTLDYAYHIDEALYAAYLAKLAQSRGVTVVDGQGARVVLNDASGKIDHLSLPDGQDISADFYLDCTGARGLLIKQAMNVGFQDWSSLLPCDRMVSVSCEAGTDFTPATTVIAREAGWQWRTPLQQQTSTGYVYASAHQSDDDAIGSLFDNLDGRALGEPVVSIIQNGRTSTPFYKNVLALGEAAGYLEPMEATGLHMIQSALTRLLALWPTKAFDPLVAHEYNHVTASELELARDFLVLHYHASTRTDTPFWRQCQDIAIPDGLAHRLAHWRQSGRLISPQAELFQSPSWLSVYVGQGVETTGWDPLADARAEGVDYKGRLGGVARIIAETAAQMPLHKDLIAKSFRAQKL
jgi:tryptophan 7-halogenase